MKLCNEKNSIICDSKKCPNNNNSFSYLLPNLPTYPNTSRINSQNDNGLFIYLPKCLPSYIPIYDLLTNKAFV